MVDRWRAKAGRRGCPRSWRHSGRWHHRDSMATTPICRCRVLYLGSSVPHVTKDGLQGIQGPLKDLYPEQGPLAARGIDSWLSVWSNGLLLENVDDNMRQVTRFFPIDTLHYCAAVRYVVVPAEEDAKPAEKFLPLDSPFARRGGDVHPPLFACILRRTSGIKVLECHAFICKKVPAANALVRCCFHAYTDSMMVRQMEENGGGRRARSLTGLNMLEKFGSWHGAADVPDDNNYKVWAGGTIRSACSGVKPPRQMVLPSRPPPPSQQNTIRMIKPAKLFRGGSKSSKKMVEPPMMRPKSSAELYPPPPSTSTLAHEHYYTERRSRPRPPPALTPVPIPLDEPDPLYTSSNSSTKLSNGDLQGKKKKSDSPFNTGIYRKKGHLNERAFSYSIRQEHRSRSNSLANLQFFDPEDKKDCELAQLVSGLELNGTSTPQTCMDPNFYSRKKAVNGYKR